MGQRIRVGNVVYPFGIGTEIKPVTHAFPQFNLPPVHKQTYKQNPGIQAQIIFLRRQHRSALKSTFQPHPDHHRYRDVTRKIERLTTGMQVYHSNRDEPNAAISFTAAISFNL